MGLKDSRKLSVRELISIIYRTGDLETESYSNRRAVEGTKGHKKVQQSRGDEYKKEVKVEGVFNSGDLELFIEGRMDGLLPVSKKRDTALIEEIKTVKKHFPESWEECPREHKLQLLSYVYLYSKEKILSGIDFKSIDGKKVNLIFVMGADPNDLNLYLRLLAELSKLLFWQLQRVCLS